MQTLWILPEFDWSSPKPEFSDLLGLTGAEIALAATEALGESVPGLEFADFFRFFLNVFL